MSDFENRIFEKMQSQEQEEIRAIAEQKDQRLAEMEAAAKEARLQQQATLLGMQAVTLLQKHNVPSMQVWELAPTGRQVKSMHSGGLSGSPHELIKDELDYFHTGQGWSVYHIYYDGSKYDQPSSQYHVALSNSGKMMDRYKIVDHSIDTGWKRQRLDGTPIQGIVDPEYLQPHDAISSMNGDYFQEGIASLMRGKGKYVKHTD